MTMDTAFSYSDFEGCVAYFKAHPPVGGTMELEFSEEEIQRVRDHAARYDCTLDVFLTAVIECFMTELTHRDRRAAIDAEFAEAKVKLRDWILVEAERQGKSFPDIETGEGLLLDDFIRAGWALGFQVDINTAQAAPGETGGLKVHLPE